MKSAQPVRLALRPSPALAVLILAVHAIAAGCFLTVLKGWPAFAASSLMLALGAAAAWDRALLRGSGAPRAIEIQATGEAFCRLANGELCPVDSTSGAAVGRYWVALRLRAPWRRSLLVAAGNLTADNFRLLRLWALWGRLPGVAPRQLRTAP